MAEINFRKIDIDAYDEDAFVESELYQADPRDPGTVFAEAQAKSTQVRTTLSRGDIAGALSIVLSQSPYGPDVEDAKSLTLSTVLLILNSTKVTEIPNILRSLDMDQQDTLMKYLYKGMEAKGLADANGSVLLNWHEKLTEVAGIGCIVRVMADRRRV
ncbi:ARP2/3 complex 16 kDa subunit (p16-Arc) [Clavulina sp. PMI_390]|nr:ARP2/3 complex 16 kDa subunit (p16-Arc) [Clavulina sp. PMI_390]